MKTLAAKTYHREQIWLWIQSFLQNPYPPRLQIRPLFYFRLLLCRLASYRPYRIPWLVTLDEIVAGRVRVSLITVMC